MAKVTIKDVEARMDKLEGLLEKLIQAQTKTQVSAEVPSNKKEKVKTAEKTANKKAYKRFMEEDILIQVGDAVKPAGKAKSAKKSGYKNKPVKDAEVVWYIRIEGKHIYACIDYEKTEKLGKSAFAVLKRNADTEWVRGFGFEFKNKEKAIAFIKDNSIVSKEDRQAVLDEWDAKRK